MLSTVHRIDELVINGIPLVVINMGVNDIWLSKETVIAHLDVEEVDISEVTTQTVYDSGYESDNDEKRENDSGRLMLSPFIILPADKETHQKAELKDKEIDQKYKDQFEDLCEKYKDIFSLDSQNIGKTPLLQMEIETSNSQLIGQKPYTLALKHAVWVKR